MQKAEKRLFVRGDVEPLPDEVATWLPPKIREASQTLEAALERREEAEIAHEIAESDARSAARATEAAEDAAIAAGKPIPPAGNLKAVEALETARRSMHASDRVAAAAVDHYIRTLDEHDEEIGAILGARIAAENERARRALADVESAIVDATQLDRLGATLRNPRWTGSQPMSRRAWATPTTAETHAGLAAVAELFNIVGGREVAIAA
jgi:hypothetical protein